MGMKDARIDAYIAGSREFARPILKYLRRVVHEGCPKVEETMKWSSPHFDYKGIFCGMAAFKEHCTFGFWKGALLTERLGAMDQELGKAMGQFGRIASLKDLPPKKVLLTWVREAAVLNDEGVTAPRERKARAEIKAPAYFLAALKRN